MTSVVFKGVVHGKVIELENESGLPDGQKVSVQLRAEEEPPKWLERLSVDPSIALGKLLIKGTRLLAEISHDWWRRVVAMRKSVFCIQN